jgi:hypothetical protein
VGSMSERHYQCPGCKATVSVPHGRRVITIEMVRSAHEATCPTRRGAR